MNISEIFIRRPVATALLMAAILVFGAACYELLPVSALPSVDFPTIVVNAQLPGASPDTMAATVATPLENEFTAIPGLELDVLDQRPRLDDHHASVRSEPQHRRRRQRRPDRDQRRRRAFAEEPAQSADLSQDQPGGPAGADLCGSFGRDPALSTRCLRQFGIGAVAVAHRRGRAGHHRRPAAAGGACAGQSRGARRARHRHRSGAHRARQRDARFPQGQSRGSAAAIHPRHQRPAR